MDMNFGGSGNQTMNVEEQVLCLLFHILVCFPDPFYVTVTADFRFLMFVLSKKC